MRISYALSGGHQTLTPKRLTVLQALSCLGPKSIPGLMRETYPGAPKLCEAMVQGGAHWVAYDTNHRQWELTRIGALVVEAVAASISDVGPVPKEVKIQA
jgi:hypothetical protein